MFVWVVALQELAKEHVRQQLQQQTVQFASPGVTSQAQAAQQFASTASIAYQQQLQQQQQQQQQAFVASPAVAAAALAASGQQQPAAVSVIDYWRQRQQMLLMSGATAQAMAIEALIRQQQQQVEAASILQQQVRHLDPNVVSGLDSRILGYGKQFERGRVLLARAAVSTRPSVFPLA